jgi:hypothetical protein
MKGPKDSLTSLISTAIKLDVVDRHGQTEPYVFDFECLYPNPIGIEMYIDATESAVSGINEQRFHWYCENYGTSTTRFFKGYRHSDEEYIVKFWSSYTPPLGALEKISRDYPEITFEIVFWGMGSMFCGTYAYRNGECIVDDYFGDDEFDDLFIKETYSLDATDGLEVVTEDEVEKAFTEYEYECAAR